MKTCLCAVAIALCSIDSSAQAPTPGAAPSYSQVIRSRWNAVKRNVSGSAAAMPEANYSFRPTPEVRTFGEILGHLANEHYMFCSQVKGEKNPHENVDFEKKATKTELVKALDDSIAYCDEAYAALKDEPKTLTRMSDKSSDTPFSNLTLNVTHDSEHYGNLVTYLRMKGIVPPSSQRSR